MLGTGGAAVLPDYRREKGWKDGCRHGRWGWGRPWPRWRSLRAWIGACAIFLGMLIILLCAPEWLAALMIACLLLAIGVACLTRRL